MSEAARRGISCFESQTLNKLFRVAGDRHEARTRLLVSSSDTRITRCSSYTSIIGCSSYTDILGDVRLWVARGSCLRRSHEWLARGTVTRTMRGAAHPSGCARCGADAGRAAIKYQSLSDARRPHSLDVARCHSMR